MTKTQAVDETPAKGHADGGDEPRKATGGKTAGAKPGGKGSAKDDLRSLPLAEVEKRLGFSSDGLTQEEAKKRLIQYGPNELEEKKANPLLKLLTYFWGPIPWMIEAAVILSAVLMHWLDFFIILVLLLANAGVGFWEERQAGKAIEALKAQLAIKARAKRDGKWITPPARELVPGDVIRLRMGDIVPADARLLEGDPVEVDQSALTGESLPATRKIGEALFSASIIRQGESDALVYATGTNTYFGKTAELVQDVQAISHFQKAVLRIGTFLIILAAAMVALIIVVSLIRGDAFLTTLQFALVLTVAAIPVAMPTVLSVTMAVGARLLAKRKAIVSRLVAIEELAGVDILCSDKTGTLTQNKLTLGDPFGVNNVAPEQVILDAALASRADNDDTIDLAVLAGVTDAKALRGYHVVHFQPFDPVHKFHIVDVLQKRGHIVGMTGDGVNDAPALKKADCGIAVSSATDAARAAASIVLTTPGLSVIIEAIKESRRIVQRMNSYAIYRIAETLRVLLFITLAILIFNFFPVTAVMIVMLALLNDGSILSIAYDRVHYKDEPEAWNMRLVLGMASVLGFVGPIAAFGMFYIGDRVLNLNHAHIQTLMYLLLSVAGSLTIYLSRTRGPFWSIRPARILVLAVSGAEAVATLLALFGIFMPSLSWRWVVLVWVYSLAWFLVTDRVKLLAMGRKSRATATTNRAGLVAAGVIGAPMPRRGWVWRSAVPAPAAGGQSAVGIGSSERPALVARSAVTGRDIAAHGKEER
jgi:magnesium-transporting ATPase (P-type)